MIQIFKPLRERISYIKSFTGIVCGIILCVSGWGLLAYVLGIMLILAEIIILLEKLD